MAQGWMAMPIRAIEPDGRVSVGGGVPETLRDRPDIPYAASLIIPEWRTEEALRQRLAELGGAVELGLALAGFEASEEGVLATVQRGAMRETISADWLVGCDGGHSSVRKRAGIAFEGETREEIRMIVADLAVSGLDREAWHMWRHEEGVVTLCPLPSTDLFQYSAALAPGQDPALTLSNLQAILERRTGRTDVRLAAPQWSSVWRANVRLADRYREGRVFLAGDAAHIHSPAGGQGMNTGIQDAYNLGWKLAAVTRGASASLLDTYEAERRPIAAGVLALSNARLHDVVEKQVLPLRRDASTIQLDVGYRTSRLSRDDRAETASLRAGDRAPDATRLLTVDGECRLFDLTRGVAFTLLQFGPMRLTATVAGIRALSVVERPTARGEVADTAGHLRRAYCATDHTCVLIRPDGYIARISDVGDASTVTRWVAEDRLDTIETHGSDAAPPSHAAHGPLT